MASDSAKSGKFKEDFPCSLQSRVEVPQKPLIDKHPGQDQVDPVNANDSAKRIDIGCQPSPSGSGEILIQACEGNAFLTFFAISTILNSQGKYDDLGRAVVQIKGLVQSKFGYPNDEAFSGHPLYGRGFDGCGVVEVFGGSWVRELIAQNKIPFPNTRDNWKCRHFIFPFKEHVFECLANDIQVICTRDSTKSILLKAVDDILQY